MGGWSAEVAPSLHDNAADDCWAATEDDKLRGTLGGAMVVAEVEERSALALMFRRRRTSGWQLGLRLNGLQPESFFQVEHRDLHQLGLKGVQAFR